MATLDPARATLVQQDFSRLVVEAAGAAGTEDSLTTALADSAGASALAGRIAPMLRAGLSEVIVALPDPPAGFDGRIGATVQLDPGGPKFVVTGRTDNPNTGEVTLTLLGPEPS